MLASLKKPDNDFINDKVYIYCTATVDGRGQYEVFLINFQNNFFGGIYFSFDMKSTSSTKKSG